MNTLSAQKVEALRHAFESGLSGRAAAKVAGVRPHTAIAYRRSLGFTEARCACGRLASHRQMCATRYAVSPKFQQAFERTRQHHIRQPNPYKFVPGPVATDVLFERIRAATRNVPFSLREDVQQEIALAVLSGRLGIDCVASAVEGFVKVAFRSALNAHRYISLDTPQYDGSDTRTFGQRLGIY